MFLGVILNLFLMGFISSVDLPSQSLFFQVNEASANAEERLNVKEVKKTPTKINEHSLGIDTTAKSAIVVDVESGAVLFQKEADTKLPIASITKLMTALVFLDNNPGWDKEIIMSKEDENSEPGNVYIYRGEKVKVNDLFNLALIGSDNRAAHALARSTNLSEKKFVQEMNDKAVLLDLNDTFFVDPTGLDPTNTSTVFDISKLVYHALLNEDIKRVTASKKYHLDVMGKTRLVENTNKLLGSYLDIVGGKTGYLNEAGYCLAVEVEGEQSQRIIAVVLGSNNIDDRFTEIKGLASWAFDNYKWN